jgi:hypothetical protein
MTVPPVPPFEAPLLPLAVPPLLVPPLVAPPVPPVLPDAWYDQQPLVKAQSAIDEHTYATDATERICFMGNAVSDLRATASSGRSGQ